MCFAHASLYVVCDEFPLQVEAFPNFRRQLLKLRKSITLEKEVGLQRAQEWVDTCTSVLKEDYQQKDKMLRVTFETLLTSRLLDPPESFEVKEGESSGDEEAAEKEGEEDSGSSDEEVDEETDSDDD